MVTEAVVITLRRIPVIPGMVDHPHIIKDLGRDILARGQHQVLLGSDSVIAQFHQGGPQVIFHQEIIGKVIRQLLKNRQCLFKFPCSEPSHGGFFPVGLQGHSSPARQR